ncbi:hypothetical protein [Wolbachia endosymbiont (group A) of Apoderus coryli]|uniref:hypothetical protein n=1 Tax=Wolbachia endosymbiont (group A) of Apoderus coryli TaxID=2953980 RepID=UPI00223136EF|nr:hypothetical protein [Wolbachia endosymbiont (group A) of Apoderus coryli]
MSASPVIPVAPSVSSQCLTLGSRKKDDVIQIADTGSFMTAVPRHWNPAFLQSHRKRCNHFLC